MTCIFSQIYSGNFMNRNWIIHTAKSKIQHSLESCKKKELQKKKLPSKVKTYSINCIMEKVSKSTYFNRYFKIVERTFRNRMCSAETGIWMYARISWYTWSFLNEVFRSSWNNKHEIYDMDGVKTFLLRFVTI